MLVNVADNIKAYVRQNVHVGNLYRLDDFKIEPTGEEYTRYHNFVLLESAYQIVLEKTTTIVPLDEQTPQFPLYPVVPSIEEIARIQRGKYLTGN